MSVFFDFDGTIIDVWKRYYKIFCDFYSIHKLDFEIYKKEKLLLERDYLLAEKFALTNDYNDYKLFKKNVLEDFDYLKLDTLISKNNNMAHTKIITHRDNKENLFLQLDFLGIKIDVNNVIILNPKIKSKKEYLAGLSDVIIVGDSETEYMCADNSNTVVFLVKTGLRNVEKYTPKRNVHILESINDFYTVNKHE